MTHAAPAHERLAAALADRYRIEREIGAGGMATVYLAEDLKHKRRVAMKVLKPELAAVLGADRFVQEITTTAALQHPHILPLFDSGSVDGLLYYVMPFIDGETLRSRLDRETQLGIDESVRIARDVADALDYAHSRGIVHRDIKPENILLANGRPMVADFGIALAVSAAAGGRMTETGLSLGTPHYMSPEQATADKDITARADIYSLGSVLYEMLTGDPPHTGASAQQIIMKIVTEPAQPVTKYRKSVPPNVSAAVAKSLEKVPADRFASAKELADALVNPGFRDVEQGRVAAANGVWRQRFYMMAAVAAAAVIGAVAFVMLNGRNGAHATSPTVRAVLKPPPGGRPCESGSMAFSPDGSRLVQCFRVNGIGRLYLLTIGESEFKPIAGAEGHNPFFSPNGEWIAYFSGRSLKKVAVNGGVSVVIADAPNQRGGSWSPADTIVFAPDNATGIYAVAASGGPVRRIAKPDSAMASEGHNSPQVLPDGKAMIFTSRGHDLARTYVVAQRFGSTDQKILITGGAYGRYVPTGHLMFSRGQTLMVVRFDPGTLEVKGEPVPVVDSALYSSSTGGGANASSFAISSTGMLAYVSGGFQPLQSKLVWLDRRGVATADAARAQDYWYPRLSPDGRVVALTARGAPTSDLWLYGARSGDFNKVTFEGANWSPVWSPKGDELAFQSVRGTKSEIYRVSASGGSAERLTGSEHVRAPSSWSPDGKTLAFVENHPETGADIWMVGLTGDRIATPWLRTKAQETSPAFSPDGRWVAYTSNEAGRSEVYVQPVSGSGGKWQVSASGGTFPVWSRNGKELFYLSLNGDELVAVPIATGVAFTKGAPVVLFARSFDRPFDVAPDGRFLTIDVVESTTPADLRIVVNWFEELGRMVR